MTLSTLPANALLVTTNTPKTLNLDIEVNVQSSEIKDLCEIAGLNGRSQLKSRVAEELKTEWSVAAVNAGVKVGR